MLKIETKTKLSPEEAIKKAIAFFGPDGQGMEVKDKGNNCVSFEGAGGGVDVSACIKGKQTSVELASREWDYQVKQFISKLK